MRRQHGLTQMRHATHASSRAAFLETKIDWGSATGLSRLRKRMTVEAGRDLVG